MNEFSRGVIFGILAGLIAACVSVGSEGCAPDATTAPPIVSSPVEPWELEVERGMLRQSFETPTPTPPIETWEAPDSASAAQDHGAAQTILADIIGFPFRAAAWLAHVLL